MPLQKNILGLVQGPPCRIDVDFKDEKGRRYHKTAVVKGKNGETEELPLYTNHDHIFGEVGGVKNTQSQETIHQRHTLQMMCCTTHKLWSLTHSSRLECAKQHLHPAQQNMLLLLLLLSLFVDGRCASPP